MKSRLSFVIPAKNEADNLPILYQEILDVLKKTKHDYEIIFIDDGSSDETWKVITQLHQGDTKVTGIRHRGNFGKAIALTNGFARASGDIVFTMDADLQDNPKEIPNFLTGFEEGFDIVIGWKRRRLDSLDKVISSRLFNNVVSWTTGTKFHDINCGFKAYKKEVIKNINFGELFRLIPILAAKQNYKIKEIPVDHRPRKFGKSKFGFERSVQGGLDLITVIFLTRFARRPAQLFGSLGLISGIVGFLIGLYILYLRVTTGGIDYHYPLLFLGVLLMIVGVQFISTGLLAEMTLSLNSQKQSLDTIQDSLS